MRIASIVGTQLDLIHAAEISRVLRRDHDEVLIYPGRHYDFHASLALVEHLNLPEPEVSLDIGPNECEHLSGSLLARLERALIERQPDLIVVHGDSYLTLAGALAASNLHIPLAHLEAGRRSFNKRLPEEMNRVVTDRLSDVLFCSTLTDVQHLSAEGITAGVHFSGDVMLDAAQHFLPLARQQSSIFTRLGLSPGVYLLAMFNRVDNIDNPVRLRGIISAFNAIREPIVLPTQPHTRAAIERLGLTLAPHVLLIDPLNYADRLTLASNARTIVTDSGDVQRDAYCLTIPCITLGDSTEWPETVAAGWNRLVSAQPDRIIATVRDFNPPSDRPPIFGDGHAAERIGAILKANPIAFGQNYDRVPAQFISQAITV